MGGITEIATSAPGYSSIRPEHLRAARRDAEAQRLLDGAVRQVPRGAGVGDEPDGPVRRLADGGGGFEYFYGFIGGETNQ
jgi:arylsulfatase